ncbi:hypothetical protein [Enterobacter mori]|uniref:hypothetical protein n=1 Tax=Enterobacter mori TaxID=539813 RepID=UPI003B83FAEC
MPEKKFTDFISEIEYYKKDMVNFKKIFFDFDERMSKYPFFDRAGIFAGMFSEIQNHKITGDDPEKDSVYALCFAHYALKTAGCNAWADKITTLIPVIRGLEFSADAYVKTKVSEEKSKARRGKCNRHKHRVLEIASDTWSLYPNASLPGVRDEIYAHFRANWKDCPASDTINDWLRISKLNPCNGGVKNRHFNLVTERQG